ncbi:MAG TPA: NAD(P)/FAD-dependent oxidoreductase [Burkholderiales bacterium]|nr:NAD(P)/FAD-dependent oxidoreductase [Burkholderiales bacterium]
MVLSRREFIKWASAALGTAWFAGCASVRQGGGRVVVIGGGYAGATAAKYVRKWAPNLEVVLIERNTTFISCPLSNLVLGGNTTLCALTVGYDGLSKYGVKLINDEAVAVEAQQRKVQLARGASLSYDRLIVAPGIHFMYEQIHGLNNPEAQQKVLHAWKAGTQTMALRNQLEAMPDGGVYALCIPKSPYRCPPGPYERACQVAFYFKQAKPHSKVLILDANDDVQSKKGLFTKAWKERYDGIVEYRPNSILVDVDAATLTARLEFENVSADVLNVIPPQRAGNIAQAAGLVTANNRWCGVDFLTYESAAQKNIHVLGDAVVGAPAMPKSGHMANQQAKVCAAAVAALLNEQPVNSQPMMNNTCYSFVSGSEAMHVASVHRYDAAKKTMLVVEGSTGLSTAPTELEGQYAWGWARNIWADMLT